MKILHGIPAAAGLAIGPALVLLPTPEVNLNEKRERGDSEEITRLEDAISQAGGMLEQLQQTVQGSPAEILAAQREILNDPELKQGAVELITAGYSAEAAITSIAATYADQLAQLPDAYLAARSDDVREAGRRIVAELRGTSAGIQLTQPTILVARDLSPAELVGLDSTLLRAVVTETGSVTGHLAIVAQSLDIPAVVGTRDALTQITTQEMLIVDGEKGLVTIAPDSKEQQEAERRLEAAQHERQLLSFYRDRPGLTADSVPVEVFANIGSLAEARKAVEAGAEGVGLFRTELIAVQGLPSEEAQYEIYQEVATLLCKPLIVRTFDIGGDKAVPGLDRPAEENPFLGWRGIRLSLDKPEEVFLPQLRALLRAAVHHDIRIMLPMVTSVQEVSETIKLIEQARSTLEQEGHSIRDVPLGIMVETPAAALTLDQFEGLIDFVSIGTNDLVQYTYAVDRTNAQVSMRAQPLGLATLRLIKQICQTRVPVAVCGQMASDPAAIPLLVGLGVRELSVSPTRVAATRQILSTLTLAQMQEQAQKALEGESEL
ncbi:MAG TPA: phosphoenolpyruvate--protein phosphotransferase [Ktedonobacteraceae bacterium]|nr:phosphoenolpyruvate--protein phosphotransferase [Ktedonobacteraceae bacterium]